MRPPNRVHRLGLCRCCRGDGTMVVAASQRLPARGSEVDHVGGGHVAAGAAVRHSNAAGRRQLQAVQLGPLWGAGRYLRMHAEEHTSDIL